VTTEQQDWNDDRNRRLQAKQPELFEVVRKTVTGSDQRDGTTYRTERLGVYSSELAALRAVLALTPHVAIQPLKIDS
jgi:hypothetical protein